MGLNCRTALMDLGIDIVNGRSIGTRVTSAKEGPNRAMGPGVARHKLRPGAIGSGGPILRSCALLFR